MANVPPVGGAVPQGPPGPPGPPPPPGVPAAAAGFALTPAAVQNGVLDYATTQGVKLFEAASKPLAITFDCTAEGLKVFLMGLNDKAHAYGWIHILQVPPDPNEPDELLNLLTEYGQLSLDQVRDHVETYINQPVRAAQDSMQLYLCIKATLTKEGEASVMLKQEDFTVLGTPSGVALLKVVINESYIDTNATTRTIRDNLAALDTYMVKIDSDILKFNSYVDSLLDSLKARGESTSDLIPNLFKGYAAASDKAFTTYIAKKAEDFDDDTGDITQQRLMALAANKYKVMTERGIWNAPTEAETKIIALEAKIQKLSSAANKSSNSKKKTTADKPKKDKGKGFVMVNKPKPDWMLVPPKEGDTQSKTVNNKQYWWCKNHKFWARHKTSECKGVGYKPTGDTKPKGDDDKKLKMTQALAAIAESDDS